jgi:hypothetical protein
VSPEKVPRTPFGVEDPVRSPEVVAKPTTYRLAPTAKRRFGPRLSNAARAAASGSVFGDVDDKTLPASGFEPEALHRNSHLLHVSWAYLTIMLTQLSRFSMGEKQMTIENKRAPACHFFVPSGRAEMAP